ncbi:LLM class flavin-dependent oxidoreductase [Rhodococcus koreensis]|uniref:LLM class flavin-dependent oxidoreductase n=1 Tax=Rhodococcus koreensis TaxID=99653 RepID=UPI00367072B9
MKFSLLIDGDCSNSANPATRYEEIIREAQLADELGFYAWGCPEQHFAFPHMTTSSPDGLLATVAARTERIKVRFSAITLHKWNHPLAVVERLSMLDNLSRGRAELSTARGNDVPTMNAFTIDPEKTRAIWDDSIRAIGHILRSQDDFSYDGAFWNIPNINKSLAPKTFQAHPPVSVVGASATSCAAAAQFGLGIHFLDNYYGYDYIQGCVDAYRSTEKNTEGIFESVTDHMGFYVPSPLCASTREDALRDGAVQAIPWFQSILEQSKPLLKQPGYEYTDALGKLEEHHTDIDWMRKHTPSVLVGTPDEIIETATRMSEIGVDELLLRVDGFGHDLHMRTIELIGKHVIPAMESVSSSAAAT